jgi:Asp-tRNA(Asn)/Glu-tRNA(Gln) amidotransferase A subunit family amidase
MANDAMSGGLPESAMSPTAELNVLSAVDAAQGIREGVFTSEQLVQACLDHIRAVEEKIQAWVYLDPEHALKQAREADLRRSEGRALGPLHGVPVGIKDIIDTDDMPTEDGTVLHAGRQPVADATVVARLREAGAVIMGKTVTTELATYAPGKTRNPHDTAHTPGGSSSGSAAAVAANMVPLALGTQTNGSVIRPAAYCGVFGFKPTRGLISRHGVLKQSRWLDQIGVFARSVEDLALVAEQLIGFDDNDPDTRPHARPLLLETARQEPPLRPWLAFIKTPMWESAEAETREACAELVEAIGEQVDEFELPAQFKQALEWLRTIMEADLAKNYDAEYERGKDRLSASLRGQIERGRRVLAVDYNRALDKIPALNAAMDELFEHRYQAILTPATTGTAPRGLESTGDPVFCTLWTLCGMPAVTLPLMRGENGLPLGVQLVGRRGDDARLLRTARWLVSHVRRSQEAEPEQ